MISIIRIFYIQDLEIYWTKPWLLQRNKRNQIYLLLLIIKEELKTKKTCN